jgi:demethylmenaquinone methyltransferase/2-methoxy-6-polyprenyl-1,4-benzoquinol methylase
MESIETHAARKAFFNERADTWLDKLYKNPDTGYHDRYSGQIEKIIAPLNINPEDRVLDLGCGSGVLVPYLLRYLGDAGQLFEMDYAEKMIARNRKIHGDDRITFVCSDVMDMPFEADSFDSIICFACFPHFGNQSAALKKMSGSLKPNHSLIIAHLLSSDEIAGHHSSEIAVSRDQLPTRREMEDFCEESNLFITKFMDEPGFYFLSAKKKSALNLF